MKLSSVTPAELCNDTLRTMLKFLPTCAETLEGKYYCLTCPYRSLSSSKSVSHKETAPDVHNNLYSFGDWGWGGGALLY